MSREDVGLADRSEINKTGIEAKEIGGRSTWRGQRPSPRPVTVSRRILKRDISLERPVDLSLNLADTREFCIRIGPIREFVTCIVLCEGMKAIKSCDHELESRDPELMDAFCC